MEYFEFIARESTGIIGLFLVEAVFLLLGIFNIVQSNPVLADCKTGDSQTLQR